MVALTDTAEALLLRIHSVSGSEGDHVVQQSGLGASLGLNNQEYKRAYEELRRQGYVRYILFGSLTITPAGRAVATDIRPRSDHGESGGAHASNGSVAASHGSAAAGNVTHQIVAQPGSRVEVYADRPAALADRATGGDVVDPLSVIVSALVAGASAAVHDAAGRAVREGYESLKRALFSSARDRDDLETALTAFESKPESEKWQRMVREELEALDDATIEALVELAQRVRASGGQASRPAGGSATALGDGAASASGGGVVVQGNMGNVSVTTRVGSGDDE